MRFASTLFAVVSLASVGIAAADKVDALRELKAGYVAFCRPSIMDELQIIGEPYRLDARELKKLADLFTAEESWYERQADGTLKGLVPMCMPHWDFKFVFSLEKDGFATLKLCTSCRQVSIFVDGKPVSVPGLRAPAMERLEKIFDELFPGWQEATAKNKREWERAMRDRASAGAK